MYRYSLAGAMIKNTAYGAKTYFYKRLASHGKTYGHKQYPQSIFGKRTLWFKPSNEGGRSRNRG